jgi:hypothetical protein
MVQRPVSPRWKTLCEAAKDEKDPQKLLELVTEINDELKKQEAQQLSKSAKP